MTDSSAPTPSSPLRAVAAAGRRRLLPALLLTAAMALVFALHFDRAHFYAPIEWYTGKNMGIVENLSPSHAFKMFTHLTFGPDGEPSYAMYSRFPIGGFALIKVVVLPFGGNPAAKIFAARMLMLAFLAASAFLAYYAIVRITSGRWIALAAVLAAFSSYYVLRYSNVVSNEMMMDLFAVMLAFHGMVVFDQEGRFRQLLAKTCIALLIGWKVYALLLPFIALGLGRALTNAVRARDESHGRVQTLIPTLTRSLHLRLGAAALLFGAALLTFNFANEYNAYGGETSLAELPSVKSALFKLMLKPAPDVQPAYDFAAFTQRQLGRVGASFPYTLAQWQGAFNQGAVPVALGAVALGICLLALPFVGRRRIPLAALAVSGLCWGMLGGQLTFIPFHEYYAIIYIGVQLTLFTLLLLWASRFRILRLVPVAAAAVALPIFALSAWQIIATSPDSKREADSHARIAADFEVIRDIAKGKNVFVNQDRRSLAAFYGDSSSLNVLLLGSRIQRVDFGRAIGHDFVLTPHRDARFPLLTPKNATTFLYGPVDPTDLSRARFDSIASAASGEPAARSVYNIFIEDGELVYLKEPCGDADIGGWFHVDFFPMRSDDLPAHAQRRDYDRLPFQFPTHGALFDGKCAASVPLPDYPVARFRAEQWKMAEQRWIAKFPNTPAYRAIQEDAALREPDARAAFNLHLDADGRALTYTREPCAAPDVERPFFLHIEPERAGDLPRERREWGFDALDFDFRLRGAVFDGKCAAKIPLPSYPIAGIRTGQWVRGAGEIWEATIPFERPSPIQPSR